MLCFGMVVFESRQVGFGLSLGGNRAQQTEEEVLLQQPFVSVQAQRVSKLPGEPYPVQQLLLRPSTQSIMILTGAGKLGVSVSWPVGVGGDIPEPGTMDVIGKERKMGLLLENGIQLAGMRHCMIQTP